VADYGNWKDVYEHLDKETFRDPDMAHMGKNLDGAETWFNNQLIHRFSLPFDEDDNPDAYGMAQMVVTRKAAAAYMHWHAQVSGNSDDLWYADKLEAEAEKLLDFFMVRRNPADAEEAEDPVAYIPTEVSAVTNTQPSAIFKRSRITAGDENHW